MRPAVAIRYVRIWCNTTKTGWPARALPGSAHAPHPPPLVGTRVLKFKDTKGNAPLAWPGPSSGRRHYESTPESAASAPAFSPLSISLPRPFSPCQYTRSGDTHPFAHHGVLTTGRGKTPPGLHPSSYDQRLVRGPKKIPLKEKIIKRFPKRFLKVKKTLFCFNIKVPQMPLNALPQALRHSLKCSAESPLVALNRSRPEAVSPARGVVTYRPSVIY